MAIGVPVIVAFGAPVYLLLKKHDLAKWPIVFLIGIAPGAALLAIAKDLGAYSIVSGTAVALVTHWHLRKLEMSLGPN